MLRVLVPLAAYVVSLFLVDRLMLGVALLAPMIVLGVVLLMLEKGSTPALVAFGVYGGGAVLAWVAVANLALPAVPVLVVLYLVATLVVVLSDPKMRTQLGLSPRPG